MGMVKCVLCGSMTDPGNPFLSGGVREVNPKTMRVAWMCGYCLEEAIEESKTKLTKNKDFDSRFDEWIERIR